MKALQIEVPLTDPRCQKFYKSVLTAYINQYVGEPPSQARSYARRGVSCTCGDCLSLNRFLNDPAQRAGIFAMSKQHRFHIHRSLHGAKVDCTHTTIREGNPQKL